MLHGLGFTCLPDKNHPTQIPPLSPSLCTSQHCTRSGPHFLSHAVQPWSALLALPDPSYPNLALLTLMLHVGPGLILADSANMGMRIAYSFLFIRRQIRQLPDRRAQPAPRWLPGWQSCAASAAAACAVCESLLLSMSVRHVLHALLLGK